MFSLTKEAANQIRAAAQNANAAEMALRVAAIRGADGEIEFTMGFDEGNENDTELAMAGVKILISKHSAPLLDTIELDFVELTPGEFNFIFVPSVVAETAKPAGGGCGTGGCGSGGCGKKNQPTTH